MISFATIQKLVTFLESLPYSQVAHLIQDIVGQVNTAQAIAQDDLRKAQAVKDEVKIDEPHA